MKSLFRQHKDWILAAVILLCAPFSSRAAITIDTSNSTDWKISNGVLTVDWLPGGGRIFSIHWAAFPNQELIDQTNRDRNGPKRFYMDRDRFQHALQSILSGSRRPVH